MKYLSYPWRTTVANMGGILLLLASMEYHSQGAIHSKTLVLGVSALLITTATVISLCLGP